mgnify:CR=1 FL=1
MGGLGGAAGDFCRWLEAPVFVQFASAVVRPLHVQARQFCVCVGGGGRAPKPPLPTPLRWGNDCLVFYKNIVS